MTKLNLTLSLQTAFIGVLWDYFSFRHFSPFTNAFTKKKIISLNSALKFIKFYVKEGSLSFKYTSFLLRSKPVLFQEFLKTVCAVRLLKLNLLSEMLLFSNFLHYKVKKN